MGHLVGRHHALGSERLTALQRKNVVRTRSLCLLMTPEIVLEEVLQELVAMPYLAYRSVTPNLSFDINPVLVVDTHA